MFLQVYILFLTFFLISSFRYPLLLHFSIRQNQLPQKTIVTPLFHHLLSKHRKSMHKILVFNNLPFPYHHHFPYPHQIHHQYPYHLSLLLRLSYHLLHLQQLLSSHQTRNQNHPSKRLPQILMHLPTLH